MTLTWIHSQSQGNWETKPRENYSGVKTGGLLEQWCVIFNPKLLSEFYVQFSEPSVNIRHTLLPWNLGGFQWGAKQCLRKWQSF